MMEFITCSTAMWDDPWFMTLTLEQQHLFVHLFLSPNNDYGFQEYNPGLWAFRCKIPIELVDELLAKYEADGKIKREGNVLWLVNSIKHMRLAGPNLTGALNGIDARWGQKAPGLVKACVARYPPGTPSIRGKDGAGTGSPKTNGNANGKEIETSSKGKGKLKEGATANAGKPAEAVGRSKRQERRMLDQKTLDELVATKLPEKAHTAWAQLVDGMASKNTNGFQEPSVPLRLLREIIEVIETDELSPAHVSHGLWACVNARGGPAGNKTYFRKAANGYTPEIDFNNSGGGSGRGDTPPPSGRPPVPPPPPGFNAPPAGAES